jgi:glycosyltransferase involved in cell wall biosynthesis
MPKVSIVIPVYNVEKYLSQCLDSLISQTLKNIEIICVNDGSTDGSNAVLKKYALKDKRIKVINKKNSGYGHSVNIGIDNASAPYIGIIESDDFVAAKMFEDLHNLAVRKKCDIAKSDWYDYSNNRKLKKCAISNLKLKKVTSADDKKKILIKVQPSVWSAIYRKKFLIDGNIRFLETPGASYQDISFTFKAITSARSIYLSSTPHVYYRCDNFGSSVKKKENIFCVPDEYAEIERYLDTNLELKQDFLQTKYINQYNSYIWNLKRIGEIYRKDFLEHWHAAFRSYYEKGELSNEFFAKINKKQFFCLINTPDIFWKRFKCRLIIRRINQFRRNLVSVRCNNSGVSVTLFGKRIIEWNRNSDCEM